VWVRICQYLVEQKKEYVLSKLLRSGTSVGAMLREAEHAESGSDFSHKLAIAQKEINESMYWLELLKETNYLNVNEFEAIHKDAVEIIKLLTAILKSTKSH
jgi:four helix bundle protein